MHKWNIGNGSVEMIDDPFAREVDQDWHPNSAKEAEFEELESHLTTKELNSVPKTAKLDLVVKISIVF